MTLVYAVIICLLICNLIPWIILGIKRPDVEIQDQLSESDSALAQLIQIIMQKMDGLENMEEDFRSPGNQLDFGTIIGQIIQQKMNPTAEDVYMRSEDGTFNGPPQIIETTPTNDH